MFIVYGETGIQREFTSLEEAFAFAEHLEECGISSEVQSED